MQKTDLIPKNESHLCTKIINLIEHHWYKKPIWWLSILLLPLSWLFRLISKLRYYAYSLNVFKRYNLDIPVIIIGNISVGGVGKTPFTQYLIAELTKHQISAGVILRGYNGTISQARIVSKTAKSTEVGDEALIYATHDIPVAIGKNRYLAGVELLKYYPNLQVILSDDGLQHYRLRRDYEIAIIDYPRISNNLHILPMGSLREPTHRLESVNAIILSGNSQDNDVTKMETERFFNYIVPNANLVAQQTLELETIYNPTTKQKVSPDFFKHSEVVAMAATGNPQKFFSFINDTLKINSTENVAYPDHYQYTSKDIIPYTLVNDAVLVTEKDYVKISQLHLNDAKIWVVLVKVILNNQQIIADIISLVNKGNPK